MNDTVNFQDNDVIFRDDDVKWRRDTPELLAITVTAAASGNAIYFFRFKAMASLGA